MHLRPLKKPLYSNCVVLAPDGTMLCRAGERRINWYLSKGLAEKVTDTPPTIKLLFKPAGAGDADDPYMLADRGNLCVICGHTEDLTRHHVVPYSFRAYFPDKYKSHTSYDVLPLCVECHEKYETEARKFRKTILDELKIVEQNEMGSCGFPPEMAKAIKAAIALIKHKARIPEDRAKHLRSVVAVYLAKEEVTPEDLTTVSKLQWTIAPVDFPCASKKVVDSQKSIDEFATRWRLHFLETMKPKHMPDHWDPKKKVYEG